MRAIFHGQWRYQLRSWVTQFFRPPTAFKFLIPFSALLLGCATPMPHNANQDPLGAAFFYGHPVPVKQLSHYPWVVVEAENLPDPTPLSSAGTTVFAYVSVGEAEGWRTSTRQLDARLFFGENKAWQSRVADLTQPGWRTFLIEERMTPLWKQGYRAFFLDTLDSYQLAVKDQKDQAIQEQALADIIEAMHDRFPGVKLLLNRGFTVLPKIGHLAAGVVAESLFQGWNASEKAYVTVSENDRAWLLAQLRTAHDRYHLPITVIDYVDPNQPTLARETAKKIRALGYFPWVATPALDTIYGTTE